MTNPPATDLPPGTVRSGQHPALASASGSSGRWWRWRRRIVRGVGVLVVVALAYLAVTFLQVWRASSQDDAHMSDAIVVMGAAQYDGKPSPVLERRLRHALELYRRGLAPRIVVTGGRQEGDTFTEATAGYNWLRARGVPDDVILKEVQGRNTYESLSATSRFLRDMGMEEVMLVSDGYHALRIEGTAREVGLVPHVSVVSADSATIAELGRETVAVSVGRIAGYRRLTRLTG